MKLLTKRAFDLVIAATVLVVASPLILAVAIAVRLSMGAPVLFRHVRPGLHEKPFVLYKFRTMVEPTDMHLQEHERLFSDSKRVTRIGHFLRKTSLDELPQLFNVVRGDMSLVGPRPLLMEYLPMYTATQQRRHLTRPGITGLAQVEGRQEIRFSQRLDLDVSYADHWSLWLDLKILALTLLRVVSFHGVVGEEQSVDEIDDLGLTRSLSRASELSADSQP